VKRTKAYMPGSHNKPAFQRHRYPPISLAEMRARVARFQKILGHMPEIVVQPIFNQFFQISAG
jgi:hypothetical protein